MDNLHLSGPCNSLNLQVFRESLAKPWGFRLQGGTDKGSPLFIQRVFSGSPAEGVLQRGDVVRKLENLEGDLLEHKTAQDMVRVAGHQLYFRVDRYDKKPIWSTNCSKQHDHFRDRQVTTQTHRSSSTIRQKTPSITHPPPQNNFSLDNFNMRHNSVPHSPRIYSQSEQNSNFVVQQEVFLHKPQNHYPNFSGSSVNGPQVYYGSHNAHHPNSPRVTVNRTLSNPVIAHSAMSPSPASHNPWSVQSPNIYSSTGWGPVSNGRPQMTNAQHHYQQQTHAYNSAPQRSRTVSASMVNINSYGQPAQSYSQEWTVISQQPGRKRYSHQVSLPVGAHYSGGTHPTTQWDNAPLRSSDQFGSTLSLDRGMSIMRTPPSPQLDNSAHSQASSYQKSSFYYSNIPKMNNQTHIHNNINSLKSFSIPSQPQTYDSLKLMKPNNRSALKQKVDDQTFQISPNLKTSTPVGFQKSVAFDFHVNQANNQQGNNNITEF